MRIKGLAKLIYFFGKAIYPEKNFKNLLKKILSLLLRHTHKVVLLKILTIFARMP
jgi:hypothetical protein